MPTTSEVIYAMSYEDRAAWNAKKNLREVTIARWVDRTMGDLRAKGTDAATTCAILGLVGGAAKMAISHADGSLDEDNARMILDRVCQLVATTVLRNSSDPEP